jgi:hypothetical protein
MDHEEAVRLKATERYLLSELDPDQRDQFEEHLFDCHECALDVRAAAMFVEQSKSVLLEATELAPVRVVGPPQTEWFSWLRPAFAVPALVALLMVIGYEYLVAVPHLKQALNSPRVMPWAQVTVGTWGAGGPVVSALPGKGFMLLVRIPPEDGYLRYTADLYNPAGGLEWSLPITAQPGEDQYLIQAPGTTGEAGKYTLAVSGVSATGERKDLGRTSFELRIQK